VAVIVYRARAGWPVRLSPVWFAPGIRSDAQSGEAVGQLAAGRNQMLADLQLAGGAVEVMDAGFTCDDHGLETRRGIMTWMPPVREAGGGTARHKRPDLGWGGPM
jgi:hypothetical protein